MNGQFKALVQPSLGLSPMKGMKSGMSSMQHLISGMIKPKGMKIKTRIKTKIRKINLMKKGVGSNL